MSVIGVVEHATVTFVVTVPAAMPAHGHVGVNVILTPAEFACTPDDIHVTTRRKYLVAASPVNVYGTIVAPDMFVHVALSGEDCHCRVVPVAVYPMSLSVIEVVGHATVTLVVTVPATMPIHGHAAVKVIFTPAVIACTPDDIHVTTRR